MKEWMNEFMNGMISRLLGQQQRQGPQSRVARNGQISALSHGKQSIFRRPGIVLSKFRLWKAVPHRGLSLSHRRTAEVRGPADAETLSL